MSNKLEIKYFPIDKLIPYSGNARTHSDKQVKEIVKSIKKHGWTNPILLDGNNGIIAGHGRLLAARKLGLNEVPTIDLSFMNDAQKAEYIIADNKLALNADWDMDLLRVEFDLLEDAGIDITDTGFSEEELDSIRNPEILNEGLCDENEVPEITESPKTKLGDVWELGQHWLMCGDSTMIDNVEKLMGGDKADMVFTDPPYNIASENSGFAINSDNKQMKKLMNSEWDKNFHPDEMLNGLSLILSENCSVYICTSHHLASKIWEWMKMWSDHYGWCVWTKPNPMPSLSKRHWTWNTELICYATRGKHIFNFPNNGHALSSWEFTKVAKCDLHPTMKPVSLAEHAITHSSNPNQNIIDLFGGSGSTLIACEKTNRQCFMMEISPAYCDVIINRWQKFTGKQAILESTQQTFDEVANGQDR